MKMRLTSLLMSLPLAVALACGGGGGSSDSGGKTAQPQVATPTIQTTAALSGAEIVTLTTSTSNANIYYTLDGTAPTTGSSQYFAPMLVSANATLTAVGMRSGYTNSAAATQSLAPGAASGSLIWTDEFTNSTGAPIQPNASTWTYDTGNSGFGNSELETYCAWGSTASPCDTANPNAYVGTDGYLHVVARNPSPNVYTSARLKSQGLFSLQYGRVEARIKLPEGQGLWPAFWMLGNNIATVNWPACGEHDITEHINDPSPDWIAGSIHGPSLDDGKRYPNLGQSFLASDWHIYGMIWSPNTVSYYVDLPSNVYATFSKTDYTGSAVWPFETNSGEFIILNLAVGGNWPGSPDGTTPFPAEMLVDYVRVYAQ